MGVPKFFRYISERYPCLSEVVREYQIPEFDNMYLDMNGIIHMCSHPDDNNPHFRITEEKIFQDVFHYIEVLFRMIRPQKLFFMAIDGVAPRAKMNQQRGRRFRSAKDASKQEEEAKKKGEELPTESRFDSNCITPGTVFMARLHEQLKYFVVEKISNDSLWRNCKIILSGHETPGEGEHKIMDYIRYIRSRPGYDPNTRHCLYGLDADLIMLGLCTHEPHFSLLREEVKFGKKSTKRQSVPEEITFFLLHLSLMREYLELEFAPVRDRLTTFEYDFEKIIDDWVLMGFLVGNDFIPHLPNLHIANGALPILYNAYMGVLPTLDGYINEGGRLNLQRFEKFMQKLSSIDLENFEEIRDDMLYMESKTGRKWRPGRNGNNDDIEEKDLIEFEFDDDIKTTDSGLDELIKQTEDLYLDGPEDESDEDDDDDQDRAFTSFKRDYYRNKLDYAKVTPEVMRAQAEGYVRAIQWNLNYYYNGVCSWSWYYPHHYSPYISDIKGFQDLKLDFDLGKPFLPYEQLLGVLPAASKVLLPKAYHDLMTAEDSPLKSYYPENFDTDLNGKKQDWEAVVLIPFMDENSLLEAMRPCNEKLTLEEKNRNKHGPMLAYTYTEQDLGKYESPAYFAEVRRNHAKLQEISIEDIRVPTEKLIKGAYPGVKMDVYYPGFPTMKHLQYEAAIMKAKVKVFEQPSRNENMIIRIISEEREEDDVPTEWLGTSVFVGWPHLVEARVQAVSNENKKWVNMGGPHHYNIEERFGKTKTFKEEASGVVERYKSRMGVEVGKVNVLVHVQIMTGRKYVFAPNGRLNLEKQFSEMTANYPVQTVVANIDAYDSMHTTFRDVSDVFPEGSTCFTLSNPYYGAQGIVLNSKDTLSKNGRMKVCISVPDEPDFTHVKNLQAEIIRSYKTLFHLAGSLGMSNHLFSRMTGSIFVITRNREGEMKNVNIGLDLKFNKKNRETPGYTRKIGNTWYYTDRVAELVNEYAQQFPEVLEYFCRCNSFDDVMADDIFGKDESDEKVKEIQQWLKTLPSHNVEKTTCGSQTSEPEVVKEIENIVDTLLASKISSKKVTMQIKPSLLYKPEIQSGTLAPDPKMTVQLFDRIVNTRVGFSVPFAQKGTVTAICPSASGNERDTMYEVVFDRPFKDGMALNCGEGRGYRLPKTAFINITYGKRLIEEKAGALRASGKKPDGIQLNLSRTTMEHTDKSTNEVTTPVDTGAGGRPQRDQINRKNPNHQNASPFNGQEYHQNTKQYPYKPAYTSSQSAFAQFTNLFQQPPSELKPEWKIPDLLLKEPKKEYPPVQRRDSSPRKPKEINISPDFAKVERKEVQKTNTTPRNEETLRLVQTSSKISKEPKKTSIETSENGLLSFLNQNQNLKKTDAQTSSKEDNTLFKLLTKNLNLQTSDVKDHEGSKEKSIPTNENSLLNFFNKNLNHKTGDNQGKPTETNENSLLNVFDKLQNLDSRTSEDKENSHRTMTVNTDFLKTILKIGENSNQKQETNLSSRDKGKLPSSQRTAAQAQVSSNVSFEALAKVAQVPASVRLLTYYQSNQLGVPRYQYIPSGNNVFKAQITLTDGQVVMGKPGKTKEEATESVASQVLERLINKAISAPTQSSNPAAMPSPPRTWVEQKTDNIKPALKPNPFVPLQAVKNQRRTSSNSQSDSFGSSNGSTQEQSQQQHRVTEGANTKEQQNISKKANSNNKNKPKSQRKPRIAANFVKK